MTHTFLRACGATSLAIGLALAGSSDVSAQIQPAPARAVPPVAPPRALAVGVAAGPLPATASTYAQRPQDGAVRF